MSFLKLKICRSSTITFLVSSLLGCASTKTTYKISSTPSPAKVEVNGNSKCQSTPCEIVLHCALGLYGESTLPAFIAAFPIDSDIALHPQYNIADICKNKGIDVEIQFDLLKSKEGDFTHGSRIPHRLKQNFSFQNFYTDQKTSTDRWYTLGGLGAAFGYLMLANSQFKVWNNIGVFKGHDPVGTSSLEGYTSAFGFSNTYNFHLPNYEMVYLSSGPSYFHFTNGKYSDLINFYADVGLQLSPILRSLLQTDQRHYQAGDDKMDVSLTWGYLFNLRSASDSSTQTAVSASLYF